MTTESDAIEAAVWAVRHRNIPAAVAVLTVAAERIQAREDECFRDDCDDHNHPWSESYTSAAVE